ncbi:MAG: hypothetical protein SFU86_24895 [Pirellulaceae bacterium]|nr:hypothetical protein [Pirellulaceae bacterium]
MAANSTLDILNRLYVLHNRSLAVYSHYAPPDKRYRHPHAWSVIAQIAADHIRAAERLGGLILEAGGLVDPGEFPMAFTGLHDLDAPYVVKLLVERQHKHVAACDRLADQLSLAPFAQAAAREIAGEAKGHLDNLRELADELAGSPAHA